jgi:flavin reductase (DIM6/NTAB) family NADH-FMN oxidoreductase RutF
MTHTHTPNPQSTLVTSRASMKKQFSNISEEKDNITAVNWHMPCSNTHYAISIKKSSFTHEIISKSHVFVVNFNTQVDLVEKCGSISGKNIDKFKEFNIKTEESEKIDCPRLSGKYIECQVTDKIDLDDYEVFVARILKMSQ